MGTMPGDTAEYNDLHSPHFNALWVRQSRQTNCARPIKLAAESWRKISIRKWSETVVQIAIIKNKIPRSAR